MSRGSHGHILAVGQTWHAHGLHEVVILEMHPQTLTAEASVRVRTGPERVVTQSERTLRSWISRNKAQVAE
jgi:hypothetical protein